MELVDEEDQEFQDQNYEPNYNGMTSASRQYEQAIGRNNQQAAIQPGRPGRKGKNKGGPFREDLIKLMYGFGDEETPNDATVDLLETYTEEFIANLVARTMRRSFRIEGNNELLISDLLKVLEQDEVKFLRMAYTIPTQQATEQE